MPSVRATICVCSRPGCGHRWLPRGPFRPARCAKCKSTLWDRPPKDKAADIPPRTPIAGVGAAKVDMTLDTPGQKETP